MLQVLNGSPPYSHSLKIQHCINFNRVMDVVSWSVSVNSYIMNTYLNKMPIMFNQGHKVVFLIWQAPLIIMPLLIILFNTTCYACCCNVCVDWFLPPPLLPVLFFITILGECIPFLFHHHLYILYLRVYRTINPLQSFLIQNCITIRCSKCSCNLWCYTLQSHNI